MSDKEKEQPSSEGNQSSVAPKINPDKIIKIPPQMIKESYEFPDERYLSIKEKSKIKDDNSDKPKK